MDIYIVVITWAVDCDFGSSVKAFSNWESAKAELEKQFNQGEEDFDYIPDLILEKGETTFSMYEDGCYSENHIDGEIVTVPLLD